jgi:hypothetical protein
MLTNLILITAKKPTVRTLAKHVLRDPDRPPVEVTPANRSLNICPDTSTIAKQRKEYIAKRVGAALDSAPK